MLITDYDDDDGSVMEAHQVQLCIRFDLLAYMQFLFQLVDKRTSKGRRAEDEPEALGR